MPKPYTSVQVEEGKWYAMTSPETNECCDCSLVHVIEYMLENGRMFWRVKVNHRQTAIQRKKHGIKIIRDTET